MPLLENGNYASRFPGFQAADHRMHCDLYLIHAEKVHYLKYMLQNENSPEVNLASFSSYTQTVKISLTTVARIGIQTGRRKRHVRRKFKQTLRLPIRATVVGAILTVC